MQLHIKNDESFRAPYRFSNSPEALARFPFPFPEDSYMYSVNLEPHVRTGQGVLANAFDIDEHYIAECGDRARAHGIRAHAHGRRPGRPVARRRDEDGGTRLRAPGDGRAGPEGDGGLARRRGGEPGRPVPW